MVAGPRDVVSSTKHPECAPAGNPRKIEMSSGLLVSSIDSDTSCYACLRLIGVSSLSSSETSKGDSEESLRFQCPECKNIFCVDCDTFLHETLHNCPGCLRQ